MNIKTAKNRATAYQKQGILVLRLNGPITASDVDATIKKVRDERARKLLGRNWNLLTKSE